MIVEWRLSPMTQRGILVYIWTIEVLEGNQPKYAPFVCLLGMGH